MQDDITPLGAKFLRATKDKDDVKRRTSVNEETIAFLANNEKLVSANLYKSKNGKSSSLVLVILQFAFFKIPQNNQEKGASSKKLLENTWFPLRKIRYLNRNFDELYSLFTTFGNEPSIVSAELGYKMTPHSECPRPPKTANYYPSSVFCTTTTAELRFIFTLKSPINEKKRPCPVTLFKYETTKNNETFCLHR